MVSLASKDSKSPGAGKIPTKLLKDAIEVVRQPLAILFNASLEEKAFLGIKKFARVTPSFIFCQNRIYQIIGPYQFSQCSLGYSRGWRMISCMTVEQLTYSQKINVCFESCTER